MTETPHSDETPPAEPALDPKVEAMIGAKLRSYYDTLMSEPVPDRIVELLRQLDAKERAQQAGPR
jgi:hypothetical protein